MAFIFGGLICGFFKLALPIITQHGQTITVPDLKGIHIDELASILTSRHLRYKLTEATTYVPQYQPSVVLEQYPKPGACVKKGRSIYITLNAVQAPEVVMPNLVDGSVRNAHIILKSRGLAYNTITYVVDIAENAVLEQRFQGKPIEPKTRIPQGSKIDLVVGAGLHKHSVIVPDLVGMALDDAERLLLDAGACLGKISYEYLDTLEVGTVFQQQPTVSSRVNLGKPIDVWVVEANPEVKATEIELDEPIIKMNATSADSPFAAEDNVTPNSATLETVPKLGG